MKNRNLKNTDNWETPKELIQDLAKEFGAFEFDPCPLNHNIEMEGWDGLETSWFKTNFINPPYSRKLKEAFVKKGIEESKKGNLCVFLLPVSTSTKLFHEYILPNASEVRFLKGRVKFKGYNTKGELVDNKCGMHDSMIVVFGKKG